MLWLVAAEPGHAAALSVLAKQGYTDTFGYLYTAENLSYHLDKTCSEAYFSSVIGRDAILLAFVDGALAGYVKAGALELPVEDAGKAAELHRLYVLAPWQGKGVAKALMDAAMSLPDMAEAEAIYLGVWEKNLKAQRFYARYGFKLHGEYTYWVGDHADREFIFKKTA